MAALSIRQSTVEQHPQAIRLAVTTAKPRPSYLRPVPTQSTEERVSAQLERIGTIINFARGKTVCEEGNDADHVIKVVSGALRAVRLLPDGRRYITSFLLPGDFFGLGDSASYSQTLEAVADVTLVRYARKSFQALLDSDPSVSKRFFGLICGELTAAQDRLLLLGRKSAAERMAAFLLAMADRKTACGRELRSEIDLPMNRGDVADYLGLTVETVSRILTQMRSRRLIDLPSTNHVVLLKRDALENLNDG